MDKIRVNPYHTTDVKELSINNTTVTATAAELNIMDGVESTAAELDEFVLIGTIDNVSTAASYWVTCPYAATIEEIYTVINGTIATADAAITFEIATVAVTGGAITIEYDGSAAGDVDSATPTAANVLTAGQAIEIITDGASTNAVIGVVTLVMKRT